MKRKISKIFGVGLALVLVLSLSLVAAAPVAASPDVSDVWVQLDNYATSATDDYHVYFTPGADLAEDVDTITVFFPTGTVPTDDVMVTVDPDGDAVAATPVDATADVAGYRLEVTTPVDITAGSEVRLDIPDVKNPSTEDDYTLKVYTSQETTHVESSSYTIGAIPVTALTSVVLTSYVAGAVAQYTIIINQATALAVWDTITVVFPTGTGIPAMAAGDVTIDTHALDTAPVIAGRFVILTIPVDCGVPADPFTIVFLDTAGITNPTYASATKYVAKVYTSKDLGIVSCDLSGDIVAASISQVAFDEDSEDTVMVSDDGTTRAELIIETRDQYDNPKKVPVINVVFDLSSTSSTGSFFDVSTGGTEIDEVTFNDVDNKHVWYTDTAAGTATITAENTAHGWSDTWDVEVTSETVVELWDGDTLVDEYATITLALADALAGNVIKAGPGTYTPSSSLTISASLDGLTLQSTGGDAVTIIDASGMPANSNAILLCGDNVTFEGFTIADSVYNGIAFWHGTEGITVRNNTITDAPASGITLAYSGTEIVESATVSGNVITDCNTGIDFGGCTKDCMVSDNVITGCDAAGRGITFNGGNDGLETQGNTITGNTITDNACMGIYVKQDIAGNYFLDNLIDGNTISRNSLGGITIQDGLTHLEGLVITNNIVTDNTGDGVLIDSWDVGATLTSAIKFNTISGNTDYGIETTETVDATHNYWGDDTGPGGVGPGMGDAISGTDVDYEPWFFVPVSAGEWVTGESSLNAVSTVGVKVSGAIDTNQKICVARYTANPMATPEFTPLTDGFFDVYVKEAGTVTEIGIKFYVDGMTADSRAYVWDAFEGEWKECSNQSYNPTYGYIWVKVHQAGIEVPTVPTISDLAGTPFAISTEEVGVRTLQSIAVTPATASIIVGGTKQFTATGTYNLAPLTEDITATVTWARSVTSVATIDAAGLATGVAEGTTNITATLDTIVSPAAVLTVSGVFDPWTYDADDDDVMEIGEVLNAISDYFDDEITITQVLEVITLYF